MKNKAYIYSAITAILLVILAANEIRISFVVETAPAFLKWLIVLFEKMGLQVGAATQNYSDDLPFWAYRLRIWIAAFGCLAVYSFLFKENIFYRIFEHALLGCATGYSCAVVTNQVLYAKAYVPIVASYSELFKVGFSSEIFGNLMLIIPVILGILWYFQYSKKYFWLSRIPLCVSLGAGAGMGFKNGFNQLLPQVTSTFKSFYPSLYLMPGATTWARVGMGFQNFIFVVGTVSTLTYFFFAFGRKSFAMNSSAKLGRWYLMLALGVFFGNTFMTRLSALIERVHFLVAEWLHFSAM